MSQLTSDPAAKRRRIGSERCQPDGHAADVYDTLHRASKPYAKEAVALTDLILRRVPDARSLLDVACGTGEHLRHLADAFEVQGIDASDAMLDVAREKVPGIALHCDDMRSFRLGRRFDAVTCLFSSIGYLPSTVDHDAAIANMAGHVADGGLLIVEPWHHRNVWPDGHSFDEVVVTESGFVRRRLTVSVIHDVSSLRMDYTVASGGVSSTFNEEHRLRLFSVEDYLSAMHSAGLIVEHEPVGLTGRGLFIARRRDASGRRSS